MCAQRLKISKSQYFFQKNELTLNVFVSEAQITKSQMSVWTLEPYQIDNMAYIERKYFVEIRVEARIQIRTTSGISEAKGSDVDRFI